MKQQQEEVCYTNILTPIERLFIKKHFDDGNLMNLLIYLQDCVIWKRLNYPSAIVEYDDTKEKVETQEELIQLIKNTTKGKGFGK